MAIASGSQKENFENYLKLPVSRVRTIMKSTPDIACLSISPDSVEMLTKVTEYFIMDLAKACGKKNRSSRKLNYKYIAEKALTSSKLRFLKDILPPKITVGQCLLEIEEKKNDKKDFQQKYYDFMYTPGV